jgi:hypothetical protein
VKIRCLGIGVLVALTLLLAGGSSGEIPRKINYQLKLTDAQTGKPITDAVVLTFRLYDASDGGSLLWDETKPGQPDSSGVITTILGSEDPIEISFDGPVWLEVEVDAQYKLGPRRELVSVPYSYRAMDSDHALNSDSLGGRHWQDYAGGTLPSGSVNQTLRHDGNNWVASSLICHTDSYVGIGTASPFHTLDVENTRDDQGTAIRGLSSTTGTDQLVYGVWGETASEATQDAGAGVIGLASSSAGASSGVKGEASGSEAKGVFGLATHGSGMNFGVYGETLSPNGYAGYFEGGKGVFVKGDLAVSADDARVSISGSSGSVQFNVDQSGDGSVSLPDNAVSAAEILDEPGVANAIRVPVVRPQPEDDIKTLLSHSIDVPEDGYVLTIATCEVVVHHQALQVDNLALGVSDTPGVMRQDINLILSENLTWGDYAFPVTVQGVFEVSSGTNTFYFVARQIQGGTDHFDIWNQEFALIYFPTAHGSLTSTLGQSLDDRGNHSPASHTLPDRSSEESAPQWISRIEHLEQEVAAIRSELETVKSRMRHTD